MAQLSPQRKRFASDIEIDTVSALVRLLIDSGFAPERIEATLRKTTAPANLDLLADCYSQACTTTLRNAKSRRAA